MILNNLKKLNFIRVKFILRGALVGVISGLVVSFFRLAIETILTTVQHLFLAWRSGVIPGMILLLFFLLVLGVNAHFLKSEPNISGSGIPQVEGQLAGVLSLNWWSVLWRKWIGGVLSIGSGLYLGREGPSIQLGASVGQGVAEYLHLSSTKKRCLIAGGAAAGLASAFNAPIAASLFVVEEVYHNFSPFIWTTSLAAAVTANFVSLNFFGLKPVLYMPQEHSFPISDYWQLIVLGVLLGCFGLLYEYLTLNCGRLYQKIKFLSPRFYGVIPLILLFFVGYFWPQTLGGGNHLITGLAQANYSLMILVGLFALRLCFSVLSYGSSLPGGIFLPILTLGSLLGAIYWAVAFQLGILSSGLLVNCIIYAMAGYFACIGKAPFTAILLVTEMVGTLEHLMPLALVSLTAYAVFDMLHGRPIYEAMLENLVKHRGQQALLTGEQQKDQLEWPIFVGSKLQDKMISQINWPKECLVLAVRRGEKEMLAHGKTVLKAGDTLLILVANEQVQAVRTALQKMSA